MHITLLTIANARLGLSLALQNLRHCQIEHSITQLRPLFHFAIDTSHRALLNVCKFLNLPDGFLEQKLEDVLVINVQNVDELDVFQGVLLDRLQIQIKTAFAILFSLLDHADAIALGFIRFWILWQDILELLLFNFLGKLLQLLQILLFQFIDLLINLLMQYLMQILIEFLIKSLKWMFLSNAVLAVLAPGPTLAQLLLNGEKLHERNLIARVAE